MRMQAYATSPSVAEGALRIGAECFDRVVVVVEEQSGKGQQQGAESAAE